MSRVAIFTDSASDLDPADAAAARASRSSRSLVTFGSETFKAGVDLSTAEFWERMVAPGRAVPDDRGLVARRVQGGLRGGLRRRAPRRSSRSTSPGPCRGRSRAPRSRATCCPTARSTSSTRSARRWPRGSWPAWASSSPPTAGPAAEIAETLEARAPDMRHVRRARDPRVPQEGRPDQRRPGGDRHAPVGQADHRGQARRGRRRSTGSGPGRRPASGCIELISSGPIERLAILHTVSPDVEAFRDEVCARRRRPRPGRRLDRPRRAVRRAPPRPGLRRRGGAVPEPERGPTAPQRPPRPLGRPGLRQGCGNLADRYHRAGANRRTTAILGPQMSRASARTGPTGTRRRAPWGRPGDDPNRRAVDRTARHGGPLFT